MSQTEDEYSLETPVDDVNSTVYPTAVRKPERAQRRISFGDIDIEKEFPSPLPKTSDANLSYDSTAITEGRGRFSLHACYT